jgi:hypothetical protein
MREVLMVPVCIDATRATPSRKRAHEARADGNAGSEAGLHHPHTTKRSHARHRVGRAQSHAPHQPAPTLRGFCECNATASRFPYYFSVKSFFYFSVKFCSISLLNKTKKHFLLL